MASPAGTVIMFNGALICPSGGRRAPRSAQSAAGCLAVCQGTVGRVEWPLTVARRAGFRRTTSAGQSSLITSTNPTTADESPPAGAHRFHNIDKKKIPATVVHHNKYGQREGPKALADKNARA